MASKQSQSTTKTASSSSQPQKKKITKIVGIVAAILLVLLILGAVFGKTVTKYSVSDLVTETKDNISFSRPKQWENASNIEKLKKDFGLDANNAYIFGDKITKNDSGDKTVGDAGVMFGKLSSSTPTDVSIFDNLEARAQFEKTMDASLQKDSLKSEECQSIDNFSKNYNYGYNNMPMSIAVGYTCQLSEAAQKKHNTKATRVHLAIIIAKNGETYEYVLFSSDKSWDKNVDVYQQMMKDLKAQP